jgi:ankyrin repeat protein
MAVQRRNVEVVRGLLEHNVRPDTRGPSGETALHLAALWGQVSVMELLLAAGADPNARTGLAPEPLSKTIRVNPQMSESLLLLAAAAETKTPALRFLPLMLDGRLTPLMFAAADGHREAVQLLLRKGAKPDLKSEYGDTAAEFVRPGLNSEIADDLAAAVRNR